MTIIGVECRNCGSSHEFIDNRADEAIADMYKAIDERDGLAARLAATEENLERETALLTEARRQNADLMAIIDKRDEALGFIPLDKGMDMQDELRETKARLAEAERDAARYRFLQAESKRFDPVLGVTCKVHFDRNGSDWCNIVDLDATVDRCRATDSAPAVCNHFPGQQDCEWCRATPSATGVEK